MTIRFAIRALAVLGVTATLAACAGYPTEPRYATRADGAVPPSRVPSERTAPVPSGEGVRGATDPAREAPPPRTAPLGSIEGGALDPPVNNDARHGPAARPAAGPASGGFGAPPPPAGSANAVYEIQPGDTISGVGRRFQTPVQVLIDLNNLGPRATVSAGQSIRLPSSAVDNGGDPYATGPSPGGVLVTEAGVPPPPPPPPRTAVPAGPPAVTAEPEASTAALDWPLRGDILRRFGPVGLGERNNGINIGAAAGAEVRATAAGRVGYVGNDLAGQGLTVLVVHRDGWRSVYGHLGTATVRDGDNVRAGQPIGTVGNTAGDGRPSIHFETWRMRGDQPVAVDPLTVLPR